MDEGIDAASTDHIPPRSKRRCCASILSASAGGWYSTARRAVVPSTGSQGWLQRRVTGARGTCAAREAEVPLEHHAAECRTQKPAVMSRGSETQLQPTLTDGAKGGGVEAQEEHAQKSR